MTCIGIDISKFHHDAWANGESLHFSHDLAGFEDFQDWVRRFDSPVIGIEPTGRYSATLSHWLQARGFELKVVPGAYVKSARRLMNHRSNKNDKIDAEIIAELVERGEYSEPVEKGLVFEELRELSNLYFSASLERDQGMNKLHALVDVIFPELPKHINLGRKAARTVLREYGHPAEVARVSFAEFVNTLKQANNHRKNVIGLSRLEALYAAAGKSIGENSPTVVFKAKQMLKRVEYLEEEKEWAKTQLGHWLKQVDYAPDLLEVPGLGELSVALLLGQVGDLQKYRHVRQLYRVTGLNISEHSSGKYKSRQYISKEGRPEIRGLLYFLALGQCARPTGHWYQWYTERAHKPTKVRLVAASRRYLRICFAVAKRAFKQSAALSVVGQSGP